MSKKAHVLIVEARFYEELADQQLAGAVQALEAAGATYERISVPGALEIPGTIKHAAKLFDAFVALGCVLRGETYHFEIVANESARGIMDLTVRKNLAIGNGILTCETWQQAVVRADPAQKNKGGEAAMAALSLLEIKRKYKA